VITWYSCQAGSRPESRPRLQRGTTVTIAALTGVDVRCSTGDMNSVDVSRVVPVSAHQSNARTATRLLNATQSQGAYYSSLLRDSFFKNLSSSLTFKLGISRKRLFYLVDVMAPMNKNFLEIGFHF